MVRLSSAMLEDEDSWTCTDSSDTPITGDHDNQHSDDPSIGLQSILNNPHPSNPAFPAAQGLYDPEEEKDACGVGFVVHIKGKECHKIVSDAKGLLCNMTHRGASEFCCGLVWRWGCAEV